MFDFVLSIPFIVQAAFIGFDEIYFHRKRGLPLWERIGHPLDTLSVFLALLYILCVPFSPFAAKIYVGIALFSCLMVTKDEFIHKHHCPPLEHWVHALLFINHPLMLGASGLMWAALGDSPSWLLPYLSYSSLFFPFLVVQACAAALFCLYQAIYWNFLWTE